MPKKRVAQGGFFLREEPPKISASGYIYSDSVLADAVQTEDALQDLPEVLAYSDETCRAVAEEMATTGVMSMLVVDRQSGLVIGVISAQELLSRRRHAVVRESERSRSFQLEARRK